MLTGIKMGDARSCVDLPLPDRGSSLFEEPRKLARVPLMHAKGARGWWGFRIVSKKRKRCDRIERPGPDRGSSLFEEPQNPARVPLAHRIGAREWDGFASFPKNGNDAIGLKTFTPRRDEFFARINPIKQMRDP